MLPPSKLGFGDNGDGAPHAGTLPASGANLTYIWKWVADGFPDFGMTFGNPDFIAYAEAYGARGSRVESADGLPPTLEAAFAEGGVHLATVPVDYSENKRVPLDELRASAVKNRRS
jgi:thiamine pyrophosphate-dependent acetolactate synthase large subunit-like protein